MIVRVQKKPLNQKYLYLPGVVEILTLGASPLVKSEDPEHLTWFGALEYFPIINCL